MYNIPSAFARTTCALQLTHTCSNASRSFASSRHLKSDKSPKVSHFHPARGLVACELLARDCARLPLSVWTQSLPLTELVGTAAALSPRGVPGVGGGREERGVGAGPEPPPAPAAAERARMSNKNALWLDAPLPPSFGPNARSSSAFVIALSRCLVFARMPAWCAACEPGECPSVFCETQSVSWPAFAERPRQPKQSSIRRLLLFVSPCASSPLSPALLALRAQLLSLARARQPPESSEVRFSLGTAGTSVLYPYYPTVLHIIYPPEVTGLTALT